MTGKEFTMTITKIDIRDFIKNGYEFDTLIEGSLFLNGRDRALCTIDSEFMTIMHRCRKNYVHKYVKQEIKIGWGLKDYGSNDAHFFCPICRRKTLVLYRKRYSFLCRKCRALTQQSICKNYEFSLHKKQ